MPEIASTGAPPGSVAFAPAVDSALPYTRIEAQKGWVSVDLKDQWNYRELLIFLASRNVKVRYKQTALGAAWAVIKPLFTMLLFTLFFGRLAKVPSDGIPCPLFSYTALLPRQQFAYALTKSSNSVVSTERSRRAEG
jgi:lipopolysaccharide transport system permease protein